MILADTLTLATGQKPPPDLVVSLATLTGTMHYALGERMSGFFSTDDKWRRMALAAADDCGERLCYFPAPADYRENLESTIADIKQCAEEGEADHIMAVLLLREFMTAQPPCCMWICRRLLARAVWERRRGRLPFWRGLGIIPYPAGE